MTETTKKSWNVRSFVSNLNRRNGDAESGGCEPGLNLHDDEHVHYSQRAPWLRAGVLGALDGLVSVSSLMIGVGGGSSDLHVMVLAGLAGLVGGALSMAAGDIFNNDAKTAYIRAAACAKAIDLHESTLTCRLLAGEWVSVSSQRDAEMADVEKERKEQMKGPEARAHELDELTQIYEDRGVSSLLARQVAEELTAKDVIRAHARDELGIDLDELSSPAKASLASGASFLVGAGLPLLAAAFIRDGLRRLISLVLVSTVAMAAFGVAGALLGGASALRGGLRVVVGGWVAMGITYGIGRAFSSSAMSA